MAVDGMNSLKQLACLTAIVINLTSCAPGVDLYLSTTPSVTGQLKKYDVIAILPFDKNDLRNQFLAKYYADQLIKENYKSVTFVLDPDSLSLKYDVIGIVKSEYSVSSYNYKQPILGEIQDGSSTTNCDFESYGNTVKCKTIPGSRLGVTGYSNAVGYSKKNEVNVVFYRISLFTPKQEVSQILESSAHTFDDDCPSDWYKKFLVDQLVNRSFTTQPASYSYKIRFIGGRNCNK